MVKFHCPAECKGAEKTEHKFLQETGEYNEIYEVSCLNCSHTHKVPRKSWMFAENYEFAKPRKAYLTKYPRIEPHTGEIVKSKEHEKETVRKMGFYAAPHGVDRRYG